MNDTIYIVIINDHLKNDIVYGPFLDEVSALDWGEKTRKEFRLCTVLKPK